MTILESGSFIGPSHVSEAIEAAKSGDVQHVRFVIGKMFANRVSTGTDASEIVDLAHLLGA